MLNLKPHDIRDRLKRGLDDSNAERAVDALVDAVEGLATLAFNHMTAQQAASAAYQRGDKEKGDKYASQARNRLRKLHEAAGMIKEEIEH
jgi:hypothetical protein